MASEAKTISPERIDGYAPIRDYALIGDKRTSALVARDGSIDWLPLPSFDSPSVLGALLDSRRGGRFVLAPREPFSVVRRYLENTNVLQTSFETASGRVVVTEAMTIHDRVPLPWSELLRKLECVAGEVEMQWHFEPRFDWGRAEVEPRRHDDAWLFTHRRMTLCLHPFDAGAPEVRGGALEAAFTLRDGESALLALTVFDDEPALLSGRQDFETRLDETADHWRRWSSGCLYDGRWRDAVVRSALVLEAMCDASTGAMVAAPTTSLPERIGSSRNYDYRYSWMRDTMFALDAMLRLGFREQVQTTLAWMLQATRRTHPRLRVFFTLEGEPLAAQHELDWLHGYRGSKPVHLGNQAGPQLQLGNYGDLLETAWLYVRDGNILDAESGLRLAEVASFLAKIWRNDDAGIWELPDREQYTQSKIACWVTLDRALRLAEREQIPGGDAEEWRRERDAIRRFVDERCWSDSLGAYARMADSNDQLDAAVLLLARSDFCPPRSERFNSTLDTIRERLGAGGPLLYRYTGMQEKEGAFLACSFWLVEALARARRFDESAALMDELVALANDVGLYSEEIDPESGDMLGNFPQALTHLALVNAAAIFENESARAERGD